MPRLFAGIGLSAECKQELDRLIKQVSPGLRSKVTWTRPGNWHLTLKFIGEKDPGLVEPVSRALDKVEFSAFELRPGRGGFFPNPRRPRVAWVGLVQGAEACANLASLVNAELAETGIPADERGFRAHLTIGRIKVDKGDDWKGLAHTLDQWEWPGFRADRIVLWQSILKPTGPVYKEIHVVNGK